MASRRLPSRIEAALQKLVDHVVPNDPDEDEEMTQERFARCLEVGKHLLTNPASAAIASDVNHANDMIRRKLTQTRPSQALQYSNLYSRLLSLPILNEKWAILYMLYQLSESPDPDEPLPRSIEPTSRPHERDDSSKRSTPAPRSDEEAFNEAFAPGGLKKFPPQSGKRGAENGSATVEARPARDVALKSTLLSANHSQIDPPESALLRDLPFTLQGLSSTTLPFSGQNALSLPPTLPSPIISLLHTLAEPSLLYRGLDVFVKTPANGLLGQSLRAAISSELKAYLSLIATLEGQIRLALSSLDETAPRMGIGKAGVTLKRCVVWTREATMGLRLMSLIADESEKKRGGQLISLIHGFSSSHGDPIVAAFAERLLGQFTRPFYDILRRWIYDGELSDPYLEFFVKEQTQTSASADQQSRGKQGRDNVWEDKYEIDKAMVPSIMTHDFAQKVFLIGKSLNFIRHSCGDSQWVEDYSKEASKELRYGDTATLEAWIDEAYNITMKRLMDLMENKFHLFEHLQALKNYILLGQGDFIALLMESLAGNLDRPAGAQYRHALTAQLEHAIRGSNAQYDSAEVLRRLDARMLQLSHGDIGWDCFTLEYKIDSPVDVVVTEWGSRQYLKVFNFLWRIKRVEFALASAWRRCMTGARGVLQEGNGDAVVARAWKLTRGCLAEMIHFVGQLQYYILFEVIESSWGALQKGIRKEGCTLDDLIRAHTRYLNDITHKGLLGAKRARNQHHNQGDASSMASGEDDRTSYLAQLSDLLKTMLAYRDSIDGLYSWSVSEFTRRQEADVRLSTRQGTTTTTPHPDHDDHHAPRTPAGLLSGTVASEFPALQERLRQLGTSFRTRLQVLLGDLAYQPDVDMRFLGVAMNFNDVYQPARRKSRAAPHHQATGSSSAAAGGGGGGGGGSGGGSGAAGSK